MKSEHLRKLIEKFSGARVLVLGDVMLDTYLDCTPLGVANEAPVPLLEIVSQSHHLGGAANVAANLTCLGVYAQLVGFIGKDTEAQILSHLLEKAGVEFLPVITDQPTSHKTRLMSGDHYYLRIDDETNESPKAAWVAGVRQMLGRAIDQTQLLLVSDYGKGVVSPAVAGFLEPLAKEWNIPILADLKPQNILDWHGVRLITPNLREARVMWESLRKGEPPPSNPAPLAAGLSQTLGCDVILKLGAQGLQVHSKSGEVCAFPAFGERPINTSGAGDTVLSVVAATLAAGGPLREAAFLASIAASVAVAAAATHAVTTDELSSRIGDILRTHPSP